MSILSTPANSTFGVGANHTPNAEITVNGFVDAFTNAAGFTIVPQQGTAQRIDTLGDKIMTPVVYQNLGGTESLWAINTVCTDAPCTQPTGVRWYQFDVTGGTFPATPVQQQTWTNGNDGCIASCPASPSITRVTRPLAMQHRAPPVPGHSLCGAPRQPTRQVTLAKGKRQCSPALAARPAPTAAGAIIA